YKAKREHDAIQFYTAGIRSSKEGQIDARLYANRSLCFLNIHDYERALEDADSCINIDPSNWKAHLWRAYAIGNLIENGKRPIAMEATGLASANIAGYMNPQCKLEFKMKLFYPILVSKVVNDPASFSDTITSLYNQPYTTFLLHNGRYDVGQVFATRTIQVIGIGDKVEIFSIDGSPICSPSKLDIPTNFTPEKHIKVHFENIHFVRGGGQIIACADTTVSFYRCRFSNGQEACDDYPSCKGGPGCKNPEREGCLLKHKMFEKRGTGHFETGIGGFSGVCAEKGGHMVLERCVLDSCGGGGALSLGEGAVLTVTNSVIQNNRQNGLEAREDGELYATDNIIQNNHTHGALIGPCGRAVLKRNFISGNWREGIFSCEFVENSSGILETVKRGSKSVAVFEENVISHNGLCGISLDGGTYIINGNKIFENWCWGIMAKTRASCNITNNDLYNNKSGGLRIGFNYSAVVYLDGNTVRDHTGPHIYTCILPSELNEWFRRIPSSESRDFLEYVGVLGDEMTQYTSPPIITERNVFRQNDLRIQHPSKDLIVAKVCSFCHRTGEEHKKCASCKKALYCSKHCQTAHWKRHKHFCKLFKDNYTVQIIMKNTKPVGGPLNVKRSSTKMINLHVFDPSLKGIKEGPKPDRKSTERFMVKIQSGKEYSVYDPQTELLLYDRSTDLDIMVQSPQLYHLIMECGVLSAASFTTKKIFCWASFEKEGKVLKVFTDSLPPFQTW
ncbi:MAG: right-handed parallel beta-helix repeat-containing protein, partial [Candidatus Thiodiazotropha sp.]